MEEILKYFPGLDETKLTRLEKLGVLYPEWNSRINVISRKDIDNLFVHHVLHSLSLAGFFGVLCSGTSLLDVGTGGGFPGIPLAIMYPDCRFHLVDRIGKKIKVAQEIAREIGLENVTFQHGDVGECRNRYDYVVSRAVMPLNTLVPLITKNIALVSNPANRYSNGLVCLKGGDIAPESKGINYPVIEFPVTEFINNPFFETKHIVYVPINKK